MVTSSRKLQGKGFESGTQACDGFGVLLVAVLWTGKPTRRLTKDSLVLITLFHVAEHFWTFSLAFATYMILIYVSNQNPNWKGLD